MIRCNTSISLITVTGDGWPAEYTGEAGDTLAGSIGGGGDTLAGCTVGPDGTITTDEASSPNFRHAARVIEHVVRPSVICSHQPAPRSVLRVDPTKPLLQATR
jgi:hypothetical protein